MHATAKISEDGKTFTCKIIDVSDFKERPKTVQNIPNNWGYKMQEEGHYQNYFEVIDIEIPLTKEQKERLKKEPQTKTCDSFYIHLFYGFIFLDI